MECLRLRVKDVDFEYNQVVVRDGKGQKDRITMLSVSSKESLKKHLAKVKAIHEADLKAGFGKVYPYALHRKYPNADQEWGWQSNDSGTAGPQRYDDYYVFILMS